MRCAGSTIACSLSVVVLLGCLLVDAGRALAGPPRDDFISLSFGRAAADFAVDPGDGSVDTGWSGGGKAIHLSVGRSILSSIVLEAGYGVWRRAIEAETEGSESTGDDRYLGAGMVTASLYPDLVALDGLSLRAGVGFGKGFAASSTYSVEEMGALALLGVGYEVAVDDDFSLGGRLDYGFFGGKSNISGNVAFFSLSAKLYFPKHF